MINKAVLVSTFIIYRQPINHLEAYGNQLSLEEAEVFKIRLPSDKTTIKGIKDAFGYIGIAA